MNKFWKIVLCFEALGLALALTLYFLWSSANSDGDDQLIIYLQLLCPGSWFFMMCIDCEVGTNPGTVWLFIVIGVNAVLYAGVGAVLAALLTPNPSDKL